MVSPDSAKWLEAMKSEMGSMYENKVCTLVDLPDGRQAIENKWIFKKKTDADGNVTVYKARLVAKGFRQVQGIDYDETFSPVAMLKSVRIMLAIAAFYDYEIWQMDVKTAFLNGFLEEEFFWLNTPAIAYTLGLMQSSPVKNVMYPIWAVSLLMAAGCTNAVKVYELNDNKQWKRILFNSSHMTIVGYFRYVSHKLSHKLSPSDPSDLKSPGFILTILTYIALMTGLMGRELACVLVELGYFTEKRVAKFMKNLPAAAAAAANDGDEFDPASMKGYKYPVHINVFGIGGYITIDQIWHCTGRLLSSDWCKVSTTCSYVNFCQHNAFIEKLISYISRYTLFGYWKKKIGQHSVVPHITVADSSGDSYPVNMLPTVKGAIAISLIACDGPPTNGEGSLRRNRVLGEFSMIPPTGEAEHANATSENGQDAKFNKNVSVSLSRYCAYLMNSAPELLPGYFGDTKLAMADVKREEALRPQDDSSRSGLILIFQNFFYFLEIVPEIAASQNIYQLMNGLQDREEDRSIFMRGVKLGKQLEAIPSSALRWKIMADFWAEKILYIAPSDNVKGHMELLAKGGEFLTHIWVLLTHAGILKINREEGNNTTPRRQPSQGDV
uniref:Reverse transcriptase Ty1/copia-type domain-containing protein n=1 Tax=Aegilops tauschii TaxID=37682 RepID=M8CAE8_AEGTA